MSSGTIRIANPIYDGAFKYLLDDNHIARLFLSTLLKEEITELTVRPTAYRTDIMRFRRYLDQQYCIKDNSYTPGGSERAMPIQRIYFLEHCLDHIKAPGIRVRRHYEDALNRKPSGEREEFILRALHRQDGQTHLGEGCRDCQVRPGDHGRDRLERTRSPSPPQWSVICRVKGRR